MPLRTVELMCLSVCQGPEGRDRQVDNSPGGGIYTESHACSFTMLMQTEGGGARRGWMVLESH